MAARTLFMVALLGLAGGAWVQAADRPDLNGNWQLDSSRSELHTQVPQGLTWQIEQTGDSIHVIESAGDKNVAEFTCGTDGRDCKVKESGHSNKASFYYNGPVLVELETKGQNGDSVIKRRMHVSGDGSLLTIDVMYVVPSGKEAEKMVMTKKTGSPVAGLASSSSK